MTKFMSSGYERKLISWASYGLLFFTFAFLWAPSRDALQIIYLFSFFLPVVIILVFFRPKANGFLNVPTAFALTYGAFCVCATFWADEKAFGFFLLQWFVLAVWLCGCSIVLSRIVKIDIEKLTFWFIILGCIVIISTIAYHYVLSDNSSYYFRLLGWNTFRNPNEIGAMCGVIALLAIIRAFHSPSIWRALLYYFPAVIGLAGVILSFSRAALLAVAVTSLLAFFILRPPPRIWFPPALVLLLFIVCFIWFTGIEQNYFDGRAAVFSDRTDIWHYTIRKSFDSIFIGIGMAEKTDIIISNGATYNHAHNAWIDTYYRTGVVGLLLIVFHLIFTVRVGLLNNKSLTLLLWLCFGCICSLFDGRIFFWEIGAKWFTYWLPAGLIVAFANSKSGLIVK